MRERQIIHALPKAFTRISVVSAGDGYLVRNGEDAPVRVRQGHDGLRCECGRPDCAHIESLRMCGFVEDADEMQRAA